MSNSAVGSAAASPAVASSPGGALGSSGHHGGSHGGIDAFSIAANISDLFKLPAARRDPVLLDRLVESLKVLLIARFRTLELAYNVFAEKGNLSHTGLDKMAKGVRINVDARVIRAVHDRMLNVETKSVAFLDFQTVLMDVTLRKLKEQLQTYTRNHRRVRAKITGFIRSVVFRDDQTKLQSVGRFQSKLTLQFSSRLWNSIRRKISDSTVLTQSQFLQHIRSWKAFFHEYEYHFFEEIYKRLDQRGSNSVNIFQIMLGLIFLSPETDKKSRFETVFRFRHR
ncbi:unnamed protein product [Amoebophrya sp. A25]|nr:unnamed protein product [Amoebophrya sp. A25]|eukprot:GSA25T00023087001.1